MKSVAFRTIILIQLLSFAWAGLAVAQISVIQDPVFGDIEIIGTSGDDVVTVDDASGDRIRVRANGQNFFLELQDFAEVFFEGRAGDDSFTNRTSLISIADGGPGNDRLVSRSGSSLFFGGNGADRLVGGPMEDFLIGGAGDDDIFGGAGPDKLNGGTGMDRIFGQSGDDTIVAEGGHDIVYGQAGNDLIDAGNGQDLVFGGSGDDMIEGGSSEDTLIGNAGNDTIFGGPGADFITGDGGADILCGGAGPDELRGNTGADAIYGEGGEDLLVGGGGSDDLNQDGPAPVVFEAPENRLVASIFTDTITGALPGDADGTIDPGDTFELGLDFLAGFDGATGVSFGENFEVIGPASLVVGSMQPTGFGDIEACFLANLDLEIEIDQSASAGDEIFIEFDLTIDGETHRVQNGPFVVGQVASEFVMESSVVPSANANSGNTN